MYMAPRGPSGVGNEPSPLGEIVHCSELLYYLHFLIKILLYLLSQSRVQGDAKITPIYHCILPLLYTMAARTVGNSTAYFNDGLPQFVPFFLGLFVLSPPSAATMTIVASRLLTSCPSL
jgi:hypothetical protein